MADTNLLILAREFKKLRTHVQEVLKMPVGPQGLQGEKGEQGVKGDTGAPGKDGKDGKDGVNGLNGQDGRNGADGKDGKDGLDGIGVQNAYIDFDNSLVIVLTSGQEINAGFLSQETKDAVVATFKQGAQTLNELLPIQTGNANKFLKTDGENVSWDTLDGSDINLASPPVIGNTTPNAATFTTLTATGQTDLGTGSAQFIRAVGGASAPTLSAQGSGTNVALNFSSKAVADINFFANNSDIGFKISPNGTTGNSWTAYGSSVSPILEASGASTNVNGIIRTKGSGIIALRTNIVDEQLRISHTASAVNFVQVTGSATGGAPVTSVQGSDTNIAYNFTSKGNGAFNFFTNNSAQRQFRIQHTTSAVNFGYVTGSAAGGAVTFGVDALSSDTNIDLALTPKGTGLVRFGTRTASADAPITGYIEIKDSGGTVRRLAVIG